MYICVHMYRGLSCRGVREIACVCEQGQGLLDLNGVINETCRWEIFLFLSFLFPLWMSLTAQPRSLFCVMYILIHKTSHMDHLCKLALEEKAVLVIMSVFMYECMPLPPWALDGPLKMNSITLLEGIFKDCTKLHYLRPIPPQLVFQALIFLFVVIPSTQLAP